MQIPAEINQWDKSRTVDYYIDNLKWTLVPLKQGTKEHLYSEAKAMRLKPEELRKDLGNGSNIGLYRGGDLVAIDLDSKAEKTRRVVNGGFFLSGKPPESIVGAFQPLTLIPIPPKIMKAEAFEKFHEHTCSCMPKGQSIRNYKRFTDPKDYLEELKNQGMVNKPTDSEADQAEPTAAASAPADPPANKRWEPSAKQAKAEVVPVEPAGLGRNKIGDKELERFLLTMKAECSPRRRAKRGGATMSAGEAELQEPRITFLATLPEVMRHIERLRIKNIIPGVVKRSHDWLDKDSSGNHVFTDLETNGEETLLFACAAFRGLIVNFGLLVNMNCLINEEDFHGLCGLSERYAQAIAEHHAGGMCDCCKERMQREGPAQ